MNAGVEEELQHLWWNRVENESDTNDRTLQDHPLESMLAILEGAELEDHLLSVCGELEPIIGDIRKRYVEDTRRFVGLRVATGAEHAKHHPPHKLSVMEVRASTTDGISRFFPGITPAGLTELLNDALEGHVLRFLAVHNAMFYVSAISPIGASYGTDTEWVRFDIDFSTPLAHCYPALPALLPANEPFGHSDVLQGRVRWE